MDDDQSLMELMKKRIIRSYKWQEDVVIPLSEDLGIEAEELEDILIYKLDMASLEALHARFESARPRCIMERLHADLQLCWISDVMGLVTPSKAKELKTKITNEILEGKDYNEALKDGKRELIQILKKDG